jgi:hypothetical protein
MVTLALVLNKCNWSIKFIMISARYAFFILFLYVLNTALGFVVYSSTLWRAQQSFRRAPVLSSSCRGCNLVKSMGYSKLYRIRPFISQRIHYHIRKMRSISQSSPEGSGLSHIVNGASPSPSPQTTRDLKRWALDILDVLTSTDDPDDPEFNEEKLARKEQLLISNSYQVGSHFSFVCLFLCSFCTK